MRITDWPLIPAFAFLAAFAAQSVPAGAQDCTFTVDGPDEAALSARYDHALGLAGDELRHALSALAREGQRELEYGDLWEALSFTDANPCQAREVLILYRGEPVPAGQTCGNDNPCTAGTWNREHVWPAGHGLLTREDAPDGTDLHHVRAANNRENSSRNDDDFGLDDTDPSIYTPREAIRGDVARMMFYVAVRYEGDEAGTTDLRLVDRTTDGGTSEMGILCELLAFHDADAVDNLERFRHERIAARQGNRNPFIDRPEFADMIWGAQCR